jgi:hypothetical protein
MWGTSEGAGLPIRFSNIEYVEVEIYTRSFGSGGVVDLNVVRCDGIQCGPLLSEETLVL